MRLDLHTEALDFAPKAINDAAALVGHGKYAAVVFDFGFDAAFAEPGHRVAALKAVERPQQFAAAARIMLHELIRVKAGMGDVAATSTGDAHLIKRAGRLFEDGNFFGWMEFRVADGAKKARCSTSNHHKVMQCHGQ